VTVVRICVVLWELWMRLRLRLWTRLRLWLMRVV